MKNAHSKALLGAMLGLTVAGNAGAAVVLVGNPNPGSQPSDEITIDTTWTANNVYRLQDQIYVKNGATLTIEAGTVIASTPTVNGSGSLAVTRGSQIFAEGTCDAPIIFTSTNDTATWTAGDPTTGAWRAACNEWGNLTILGNGLVGDYVTAGNSPSCNANNVKPMEGLTPDFVGDPDTLFGGGDDDDNSGVLRYVSIRYGGRVLGLGNELNGMSLGGIGRETVVDHVEIMNNVDDGFELWGGTVNLKYISVWNIGDDSIDIDCGWRGKAQFGLVVQGYSVDAAQGSGIGDNCFEMDGAEKADAQPLTASTFYNFTVIGQPAAGDEGTAWRDSARAQFRQCIFMDLGENLIENNNTDGDSGSVGYTIGAPTLTFPQIWTTAYNVYPLANPCGNPAAIYAAQSAGDSAIQQGFLAEITDSVFFRNLLAAAYSNANGANAQGVTVGGDDAPLKGNVVPTYGGAGNPNLNMPIVGLTRSPVVFLQGGTVPLLNVLTIDPRAANDALVSQATAPNDGFYTPVTYRGAFGPDENWMCGWTAADAFGFSIAPPKGCPNPCEVAPCPADITGDGQANVDDLVTLIGVWGPCAGCVADITGDNQVNVDDLVTLIGGWGPCP